MTEGLGDLDKKEKKEEFGELVGDLGLDSLFSEISAEKKKIREAKKKYAAKLVEEEKKRKEEFDKLIGGSVDDLLRDLSQAKKDVDENNKKQKERQKQFLNSFENFLTQKIDDIEEIKEEIVVEEPVVEEEIVEDPVEEIVEEPEVEEESLIEQSLGLLSEPSENIPGADEEFATLDDLQKHYRNFLVKIQQQLSTLGGGGIEDAPKTGGPYARRNQKWEVITTSADSDWIRDDVGISTTASVGIGTTAKSDYSLYVEGDARITGILTVGQSSVTIDGIDDKIIIGTGTTITEGGNAEFVGVITASGIHLEDDQKLNFGDNDDLQIQHTSSGTGIIQNAGSGQLQLRSNQIRLLNAATTEDYAFFNNNGSVDLYHDNVKRFETTGYGVTVTGTTFSNQLNVSGVSTFQSNVDILDDVRLRIGDDDDLEIFHNSSNGNTIIQETTGGNLVIKGTNLFLQSSSSENFFKGDADGAVELYYDNSKKFETTGYGVTVTGISSAQNVSIANTFAYPEYITGGMVPRAIKSQGGYDRSDGFADRQTGTNASQDPADYIEYTQEYADTGTWFRCGITTTANQANDNQWWGETNSQYDNTKGLFGGLTGPAGVDHFFDFSENTAFNNAVTTGSLRYTQALGSFSLKECQVGDLVLARFDLNIMPMVTNTTVEVGLIYANRDSSDTITFTFPLTTTPFTYGSGTVGQGYLIRPTVTAYIANDQDINSRSLLAIKADNPILFNPIGVLFTIQR